MGAILNFGVKESPVKVDMGTIEKFTFEIMDIAFGIYLYVAQNQRCTFGNLPSPNCNVRFKMPLQH